MRSSRSSWKCRAVLSLGLAAGGCGEAIDDLPREPVHGTVTLDGQPLAKGAIRFQTSTPGAGRAIEAGELIRDGAYAFPRGKGLVPGTYRVTITEEVDAPPMAGGAPGPRPKVQPPKISSANGTSTAEVKKGQSDPIDFALKGLAEGEADPGRSGSRGAARGRKVAR